jgi:hypothetical protein
LHFGSDSKINRASEPKKSARTLHQKIKAHDHQMNSFRSGDANFRARFFFSLAFLMFFAVFGPRKKLTTCEKTLTEFLGFDLVGSVIKNGYLASAGLFVAEMWETRRGS